MASSFKFKQFSVVNEVSAMKVGTDGVLLGAWVSLPEGRINVLDVGTGTGVIALMLAQRRSEAMITGMDIDAPSVAEASGNFDASQWNHRLKSVLGDFRDYRFAQKFDLIVSNPPFFINSLKAPEQRRSTARHTDTLTHTDLLAGAADLLSGRGVLSVVLPPEEGHSMAVASQAYGLYLRRICRVRTKPEAQVKRVLMEFSRNVDEPLLQEELVIQSGSQYTTEYIALTKDFYIRF